MGCAEGKGAVPKLATPSTEMAMGIQMDLVSWCIRQAKNSWIGIETRTYGSEYFGDNRGNERLTTHSGSECEERKCQDMQVGDSRAAYPS